MTIHNLFILGIVMHFVFLVELLFCKLNYHDQKIRQTLPCNIRKYWTAILTLLGLIHSVHRDLPTGD